MCLWMHPRIFLAGRGSGSSRPKRVSRDTVLGDQPVSSRARDQEIKCLWQGPSGFLNSKKFGELNFNAFGMSRGHRVKASGGVVQEREEQRQSHRDRGPER